MKNKLCAKFRNISVISLILVFIFALATVLTVKLGVNYAAQVNDSQTLTVTVSRYYYDNKLDDIETVCESKFGDYKVEYSYKSTIGHEGEIVYVFNKDVNLRSLESALDKAFAAPEWEDAFVSVSTASETLLTNIPAEQTVRACIAVAVFAVLAFAYVSLRYRLIMGITTGVSVLLSAAVSAAFILIARIPVTSAVLSIVAVSALLAAIFAVLTMNKIRANTEEYEDVDKKVYSLIATRPIAWFTLMLGGALTLTFIIGTWAARWFALAALVALLATALVALVFTPAFYLPFRAAEDAAAASRTKRGYVGATAEEKPEEEITKE